MTNKRIWLIPPLAAVFWGSCDKPRSGVEMPQLEMDVRFAVCGFAASCIVILALTSMRKWFE